jgi:Tfp pilus assembly protein PilF
MKTKFQITVFFFLVFSLFISGCGSEKQLDFTPTPTLESTPTPTVMAVAPTTAQQHHTQGVLALSVRADPEKAVDDFTQAIQVDPDFVKSYNARGVAYVLLKQYDKARADFQKALEIDPNYNAAQENLKHLDAGEYDQATALET